MPDWLNGSVPADGEVPAAVLAARLVLAAVLGAAVAAVYFVTLRKQRAEAGSFVSTLVLLTVLIAMVTVVIGNSIARAFGLVGALSIVRFRTVVDDTRDTAFVIFAVAVGMAVGAGLPVLALIGLPVVAVAAWALSRWAGDGPTDPGTGTLVVRLAIGLDPDAVLAAVLSRHLSEFRVVSAGTARQGAALELTYSARPRDGVTAVVLVGELTRTEGVVGVEWKEPGRGK
jgi:hypothetical protein